MSPLFIATESTFALASKKASPAFLADSKSPYSLIPKVLLRRSPSFVNKLAV
jgi:hypothetical protein